MPLAKEHVDGCNPQNMSESFHLKPEESRANGCLDRLLMIGAALLVCMIGVGAFAIADHYHSNPAWVFVAWNSIFIALSFVRRFRSHLKKPSFVAYLFVWAVIHGLLVVTLMRWFSIPAMLPFLAIELTLGVLAADYFLDIRPDDKEKQ
jgi:FtsH-binding integral membrane protein